MDPIDADRAFVDEWFKWMDALAKDRPADFAERALDLIFRNPDVRDAFIKDTQDAFDLECKNLRTYG